MLRILVFLVLFCCFGSVSSSHFRGGTISYKPSKTVANSVDISYRLAFRRGAVHCDQTKVNGRQLATSSFTNRWHVARSMPNGGSYLYQANTKMYCSGFSAVDDWSEGYNNFTIDVGYGDILLIWISDGGNWITRNLNHRNSNNDMSVNARANWTNNSSPVSNIPLTVDVERSIPTVVRIPVSDPDGDIVRCRQAPYQDCHNTMCTHFPYGVVDEVDCSISYNGLGSQGLYPIFVKLEDYPAGTTNFNSTTPLGSVDLQFIVNIKENTYCSSSPCRNNGTCSNTNNGYNCYCPPRYTGKDCETNLNSCSSNPCRNGGRCSPTYYGYRCGCPAGYTGPQCETNLKTTITCREDYMEIDLLDGYFVDVDWRHLHLRNTSCRATQTANGMSLRTSLDGCGTTYEENEDSLIFWNEVRNEHRFHQAANQSVITRAENLVLQFFCKYGRKQLVRASFSPTKRTIYAQEGSYGNFTLKMDLHKTDRYNTPYGPFDYPVDVSPNQLIYIQFEVKNSIQDLDLLVVSCRATTSENPNSNPRYVFLERGCALDNTMDYRYNPHSNTQRFSMRSFRFLRTANVLVYLHCELMVCHRNSANSRCSRGCMSSKRRRRATDQLEGSNHYDLSSGALKRRDANDNNQQQAEKVSEGSSVANAGLIGGLSVVCCILLLVAFVVKVILSRYRPPVVMETNGIEVDTVNSYEQQVIEDEQIVEITI